MNPVEVSVCFSHHPQKDWRDDDHLEAAVVAKVLEEKNEKALITIIKEELHFCSFEGVLQAIPRLIRDQQISRKEGSRLRQILEDFDVASADFKEPATSPARCASVMTYLATPSPKLSSDIRYQVEDIPPHFIVGFREALTRLCGRYAKSANRLKFNKGKQIVDFLKTFGEVSQALFGKTFIFAKKASGFVDIKEDEFDGNREMGLALARSGVVGMLMKSSQLGIMFGKSKLAKRIPRKIATIWGEVQPSQVAVFIRCGVLVGDNFAIEYETEEKACLYSPGSDTGIDKDFVRRLLWLSPFDMMTISTDLPDTGSDPDDYVDDDMCTRSYYVDESSGEDD